ncbi:MAG: hypothetical protein LBT53_06575 [Puniceicoccales bacterium]|nr:hypothetical protein [Puniceicoccales bacterium]
MPTPPPHPSLPFIFLARAARLAFLGGRGLRQLRCQPSLETNSIRKQPSIMSTLPTAPKPAPAYQFERGIIRLNAKYPAHNNYFCSYEVFIEADAFKPERGRSGEIYFFRPGSAAELSNYDYGRFRFYLPKSVQPLFEEALSNKNLILSVHIVVDSGRPVRDQSEAVFRLQSRDQIK